MAAFFGLRAYSLPLAPQPSFPQASGSVPGTSHASSWRAILASDAAEFSSASP
eukprot:CAMPEP_0196718168 /NCGR_PEP_ID=MMETSP1091-20130531/1450_1 /TAXON_ID=302021 /ORGANISM="Rhodomonas sp., Strain CCMP768" /LENGTH=52 /DNA_ID=CAMNT_0042058767 /DNA_START=102 /DNA_END=260 /DNA_ORIENTATION=+